MALLTTFWLADLFILLVTLLGTIYAFFSYQYQSWRKRGFPCPLDPTFPSGNFAGVSTKYPIDQLAANIYKETEGHKVVGCYMLSKPIAMVRDMEVVKNILVKDFGHFHDRMDVHIDTQKDPLAEHLFLLQGQEWRNLRIKLTPTFTSGKMKTMFPTLINVGKDLLNILEKEHTREELDLKDILARYTTDVISSVAFGLDVSSLQNPKNDFRKHGQTMAKPGLKQRVMNLFFFAMPNVATKFPFITFLPRDLSDFFINTVQETMDYRIKNNFHRNDFFQLLLQLKTLGYVKDADNPEKEVADQQKFTLGQMASQAFLFFFAGFETSSATMQFALYELALNPEIQERVQQDIDQQLEEHGGQLTYDCLQQMDYLSRVVDETLRKYPVAGFIFRECNQEYPIPGTDLKFLPGDSVWFPLYGYHHDPKYYPEPERFDPDRFLPEQKATRPHYAYMPFGEGPRNCIGNRFGLMQTKAGLAMILSKFNLTPTERTPNPIVFEPSSSILSSKGNMHLKITKRN